jgi:hypothetical protein
MKGVEKLARFQEEFLKAVGQRAQDLLQGSIEDELTSGKDFPVFLKTDFGLLVGEVGALNAAENFIGDVASELMDDLKTLFKSNDYQDFAKKFEALFTVSKLTTLPGVIRGLVEMEVGLTLSFLSAMNNIPNFNADLFSNSLTKYFFCEEGYETVSGSFIVRPKLPKTFTEVAKVLNAETLIRDMARIVAETAGDVMYGLRERYPQLVKKYQIRGKKKLISWFDSFCDLAEASVLPVVEEILLGAFEAQLNPLIAASVSTFCGVTAKKVTEHAYLHLLGIPLSGMSQSE